MPKRGSSFYVPSEEAGSSSPGSTINNSQQNDKENCGNGKEFEKAGWLQKWTNYVKGYRQRWFVLDCSGNLSYYRNPCDSRGPSRGRINLAEATIHSSHNESSNSIIINVPSAQSFHLKAANEVERSKWLKALEYSKHHAIRIASTMEDAEDESQLFLAKTKDLTELPTGDLAEMTNSLHKTSVKFLKELDGFTHYAIGHLNPTEAKKCAEKAKPLKQLAEIMNKSTMEILAKYKKEYESLSQSAHLQQEKYNELQKQYKILARQHSKLERDAFNSVRSSNIITCSGSNENGQENTTTPPFVGEESDDEQIDDEEEDQFHDAIDNLELESSRGIGQKGKGSKEKNHENGSSSGNGSISTETNKTEESALRRDSNVMLSVGNKLDLSKCSVQMPPPIVDYQENTKPVTLPTENPMMKRREQIPAKPEKHGLNLWSIMRNCIGKELTRIPIPVNFNEPLSMLQRITEDLEYSYLLDRAAEKLDICERLAYLGAFAVSCYASTAKRTTKPFNPLLGETFEFDRFADLGWRSLVEQVSHHPPAAAQHVEGVNWSLSQEFMVSSRFRGKYLSVVPTGHTHVEFKDGKAVCTFQKITTTVHNIILGKLWIDNHGEMNIINHLGGERAIIKFQAYSYFSSNRPRKVEGVVMDKQGEARYYLEGYWDQHINIAPVRAQKMEAGKVTIQTSEPRRIWSVNQPIVGPSMYNFSKMAIEMNEPDEDVAPTDSRRRPDQRLMEEGKWDEANKSKNQLEDKQRKKRRQAEADAERAIQNNQQPEEYEARWFQKIQDALTGSVIHRIRDEEYWQCKERKDWSRCPDIF